MSVFPKFDAKENWPHNQNYVNTNCSGCGKPYLGPKRAPKCWCCLDVATKEWWHEQIRNVYQ
ncbi:hypothetical protein DSS3PM1_00044 [Bacteriophage DSS3_PM1]|nr:hypothetical protein DSS3PM1_00044 [Bacteriophage DSS3_PM1]